MTGWEGGGGRHTRWPPIKEIWCNPDARRTNVATRLLTGILQHLKADHVDVEFETTNVGLMEFLLAHGFQDVYTPNLPMGTARWSCRMKHPEATVGMAWNESKLFSQAKELFVKTFQAAYAGFSEECLGLNGVTKEAWLRQTIDDEEALQTRDKGSCPLQLVDRT